MKRLVGGTRGSKLAVWQTNFVGDALRRTVPALEIETRILRTAGDRDPTRPLEAFGTRGVFTDAIEQALLTGEIDFAVHSLKDLTTTQTTELTLAAILGRTDARDVIVSRHKVGLMELPKNARVGTGSIRRAAFVRALRPDVEIVPLRGNVDTRLEKARTEDYDAIVLAAAGILRLGRGDEITEYLAPEMFLPDPGQGALAVQIRTTDIELAALVGQIDDTPTRAATTAERAFLAAFGGGCALPIGAYGEIQGDELFLRGMIATPDGRKIVRGSRKGAVEGAVEIGKGLAEELWAKGGTEMANSSPKVS